MLSNTQTVHLQSYKTTYCTEITKAFLKKKKEKEFAVVCSWSRKVLVIE